MHESIHGMDLMEEHRVNDRKRNCQAGGGTMLHRVTVSGTIQAPLRYTYPSTECTRCP